jgi:hypothetical protein
MIFFHRSRSPAVVTARTMNGKIQVDVNEISLRQFIIVFPAKYLSEPLEGACQVGSTIPSGAEGRAEESVVSD